MQPPYHVLLHHNYHGSVYDMDKMTVEQPTETPTRPARVGGDTYDPFATIPSAYVDDWEL